jgi:hypothetical protein
MMRLMLRAGAVALMLMRLTLRAVILWCMQLLAVRTVLCAVNNNDRCFSAMLILLRG